MGGPTDLNPILETVGDSITPPLCNCLRRPPINTMYICRDNGIDPILARAQSIALSADTPMLVMTQRHSKCYHCAIISFCHNRFHQSLYCSINLLILTSLIARTAAKKTALKLKLSANVPIRTSTMLGNDSAQRPLLRYFNHIDIHGQKLN